MAGGQQTALQARVAAVLALGAEMERLPDDALPSRARLLRARAAGGEPAAALVPEAFSLVREATRRTTGRGHHEVQLAAGAAVHAGHVAAMRVVGGRAATLVLPAFLDALTGVDVHVVAIDDAAARRDAGMASIVLGALGLEVGIVGPGMDLAERRAAYGAEVTYGSHAELGFDYLRDNLSMSEAGMAQGARDVALIDGIDTVLVDEARAPLLVSRRGTGDRGQATVLARVTVAGYYRLYGKVSGLTVDARPSALAEIGSRWDLAVIDCPDVPGRQTRRRPLTERVRWARTRSEDSRASVLDLDAFYDDRTTDFYALRRRLATASGPELAEVVRGMVQSVAEAIVADHCPPDADPSDGDLDDLLAAMASVFPTTPTRQHLIAGPRDPASLVRLVTECGERAYDAHVARVEVEMRQRPDAVRDIARRVLVTVMDIHWRTFLAESRDRPWPASVDGGWHEQAAEYKRRAGEAFTRLLAQIRRDSLHYLFRVDVRA
jgi:preprotein translocase subunit SecA